MEILENILNILRGILNPDKEEAEPEEDNSPTFIKKIKKHKFKIIAGIIVFIIIFNIISGIINKPEEPLPQKDNVNNIHVGEDGSSFNINNSNIYDVSQYFYHTKSGDFVLSPKKWEKETIGESNFDEDAMEESDSYCLDRFKLKNSLLTLSVNYDSPEILGDETYNVVKEDLYNIMSESLKSSGNETLNEGETVTLLQFFKMYLDENIVQSKNETIGTIKNLQSNDMVNVNTMGFTIASDTLYNTEKTDITIGYRVDFSTEENKRCIDFLFEEPSQDDTSISENNIESISDNSVSDNSISENEIEENESSLSEDSEEIVEFIEDGVSENTEEVEINDEVSYDEDDYNEYDEYDDIEENSEDEETQYANDNRIINIDQKYSKYFNTNEFKMSDIKPALSSQEKCNEFFEKIGVLDKLRKRYESFTTDENNQGAIFALSLQENAEWPDITIGSKVYVINSPINTFSIQLPPNYTLEAGNTGAILVMKDVSEENAKSSMLFEIKDFDYISEDNNYFYDNFKSAETNAGLSYEKKSETTSIDHGVLKEYRAEFESGIDNDGNMTGNKKVYIIGYCINIKDHNFIVNVPNFKEGSEESDVYIEPDDKTAQAIKSILTSIIIDDSRTSNTFEDNNDNEGTTETEETEKPKEDVTIDYDEGILNLIESEKRTGLSKKVKADNMTNMLAKSSITAKNNEYGDLYNQALHLMAALGNPSSFTYYEYLSDEENNIKRIQVPIEDNEFCPNYVFYCMNGGPYNIEGYLLSAGTYNEEYSIKNENEPGKSFDDPFTETKNNKNIYTFYVHDKDGTIVGQCTYEK